MCRGKAKDTEAKVAARWDQRADKFVAPVPGGRHPEEDYADGPEEQHQNHGEDFEQPGSIGLRGTDAKPFAGLGNHGGWLT